MEGGGRNLAGTTYHGTGGVQGERQRWVRRGAAEEGRETVAKRKMIKILVFLFNLTTSWRGAGGGWHGANEKKTKNGEEKIDRGGRGG